MLKELYFIKEISWMKQIPYEMLMSHPMQKKSLNRVRQIGLEFSMG